MRKVIKVTLSIESTTLKQLMQLSLKISVTKLAEKFHEILENHIFNSESWKLCQDIDMDGLFFRASQPVRSLDINYWIVEF